MLLDSENVTVKIISVFKVDKENTAGQYSQQTFNSISYRIYGKGTVISDNETIHVKQGYIVCTQRFGFFIGCGKRTLDYCPLHL